MAAVCGERHAMTFHLVDDVLTPSAPSGESSSFVWQLPTDSVSVIATALPADEHTLDVVYTFTLTDDDEHALTDDDSVKLKIAGDG